MLEMVGRIKTRLETMYSQIIPNLDHSGVTPWTTMKQAKVHGFSDTQPIVVVAKRKEK